MRNFKPVLNSKGLLAASIAMLSGHALAEVAGRISFASGDATVTDSSGASRALQRGASINGGDRISTRSGRVQIRFTDGGFVSLQPNTVFGVDEYLYANRKPEESSLFFSLIQGGMRTITGAIGKVNKKSYQVRTPVATIGIRGTEYLAQVNERGLIVSVGHGFVNVANQGGDITGGARQNIRVTGLTEAPLLTEEQVELLSTRPNGRERGKDKDKDRDDERERTVTIADVQNERGDYLFLFTTQDALKDSVPPDGPVYTLLSPGGYGSSNFFATFDQDGSKTDSTGGLLTAYQQYTSGSTVNRYDLFDHGTLEVTNSGTIGALSWGELTDGDAAINNIFPGNPLSLTDTQFLPYVVGIPATQLLSKGFATYTLQGATPARDVNSGEVGRVDSFVVKLNLDYATLDAQLKLSMPTNKYRVTTTSSTYLSGGSPALAMAAVAGSGGSYGFYLSGSQLSVTDENGSCAGSSSGGCSATIQGFFAGTLGTQIGASYSLNDFLAGANIQGVAALGLGTLSATAPYLPDSFGYADYLMASPAALDYNLVNGTPVRAQFDAFGIKTGTIGGLKSVDYNSTYGSPSPIYYSGSFDSGTLKVTNSGTIGALSWGEYTDGISGYNNILQCYDGCPSSISLASTQFMPYIIGSYPNGNLGKGTATYTLQGKTPARDSYYGREGTLENFAVKVNLDFATVEAGFRVSLPTKSIPSDIGGSITLPGNTYTAQTSAPVAILNLATAPGFSLNSSQLSVTDTAGTCAASSGSCYASINAFFAGDLSKQMGASYTLDAYGGTVPVTLSGVAALGMTGYDSSTTLGSGPGYSLAFAGPQYTGIAGGFVDQSLTVNFDASQLMTTATGFDPVNPTSAVTVMDRTTAQAADAGQVGALKWGRWYTSSTTTPVNVIAGTNPVQINGNESLHYIVGPMTQPGFFAGVVSAFGENATATYTYQGGSFATGSDGTLGSITAGSTLTMTFSSVTPSLALDIGIDMQSGNDYQIGGVAQLGLDATVSKFSAFTGSGATCSAGGASGSCTAMVSGFFAGQQAQQIGLGYRVDDTNGGRAVNGVGGFGRGAVTSAVVLP